MSAAHTPSPLTVERGETYHAAIVHTTPRGRRVVVARVTVPRRQADLDARRAEADANAALYAASPELLDSLEELVPLIATEYPQQQEVWLARARAAIAKARGER